jgi:allantoate deiminase
MNVPDLSQVSAVEARGLMARLDILGQCTEEPGQITRPYGSPALRQARDLIDGWMRSAGMSTRVDAVGNLIGRYESDTPGARTLVTGSHIDSVRDAGRYDGPLGALLPITCVERLHRAGRRLPFAVEIVAFIEEEGLRFRSSLLGSSVYAGTFDRAELSLVDNGGTSLADAIRKFGGDPDDLQTAARNPADLIGYVEVHIEQGPILEAADAPVGIVTAIQGQSRGSLTLTGIAGHAGTVPMRLRRDALAGAAESVLSIEAIANATPGLVATVGQIAVEPGASNVIPARATLDYDLRHADDSVRVAAVVSIDGEARAIAARRGLTLTHMPLTTVAATPCDPILQERLAAVVAGLGLAVLRLSSGAGHDAMSLAAITPAAMLFVRCRGGISHNPAESITASDASIALDVLSALLEDIAASA